MERGNQGCQPLMLRADARIHSYFRRPNSPLSRSTPRPVMPASTWLRCSGLMRVSAASTYSEKTGPSRTICWTPPRPRRRSILTPSERASTRPNSRSRKHTLIFGRVYISVCLSTTESHRIAYTGLGPSKMIKGSSAWLSLPWSLQRLRGILSRR